METVQIFTKNQRQWQAKPLEPAIISDWRTELHRLGWAGRTVSHASYLINLASPEPELQAKSINALTAEIERCEALEIPFCVLHPGSHRGAGLNVGIEKIIAGINTVTKRTSGYQTMILLETTVGSGNLIGSKFEELAAIRTPLKNPHRVGTCLDTCHISAAGYDISSRAKARAVFEEYDRIVGLNNLQCLHLNDSKEPIGSRKDRHEHIGEGFVGKGGFEFIMNEERFARLPMILETAKTETPKGTPMDLVNLRRLRRMIDR